MDDVVAFPVWHALTFVPVADAIGGYDLAGTTSDLRFGSLSCNRNEILAFGLLFNTCNTYGCCGLCSRELICTTFSLTRQLQRTRRCRLDVILATQVAGSLTGAVRQVTNNMRFAPFIVVLSVFAGCARDDVRLHGTWRSNRDATVAAAFKRDARWTNAPPQKVERFRDMFGHMTVTYSNRVGTAHLNDETYSFRYRVIRLGPDHVVIRDDSPMDMGREIRIRFENGGASYWIDTGPLGRGLEEKFDKLQTQ